MTNKLSWDEIKRRYPDEWVGLINFLEEGEELVNGVVFDHSNDKDALCQRMKTAPSPFAIEYTGELTGGLFGLYTFDVDPEDQS